MEVVINIDAYLFLVFTDLTVTLRVQGYFEPFPIKFSPIIIAALAVY